MYPVWLDEVEYKQDNEASSIGVLVITVTEQGERIESLTAQFNGLELEPQGEGEMKDDIVPLLASGPAPSTGPTRAELKVLMQNAALRLAGSGLPYLAVLGVRGGFPGETRLKGFYGRMLVLVHPDRHGNSAEATEATKAVLEAWEATKKVRKAEVDKFMCEPSRFEEEVSLANVVADYYDKPRDDRFKDGRGRAPPPSAGAAPRASSSGLREPDDADVGFVKVENRS